MPDKVSTVIANPVRDIRIRLHIELVKTFRGKTEYFHNEFTYNDKEYLTFNPQAYATLEYTGGEWSRDKSIMITEKNLFIIRKGFKEMVRNMYKEDIFMQTKEGELVLPKDMEEKYTVKMFDIGMNQRLLLKPTIVSDIDDVTYEGVTVFFNSTATFISLSISEFEALTDSINHIDLFLYSQQLLMTYMQYVDKIDIIKTEPVEKTKKNVFQKNIEEVKYKTTEVNKKELFGIEGD